MKTILQTLLIGLLILTGTVTAQDDMTAEERAVYNFLTERSIAYLSTDVSYYDPVEGGQYDNVSTIFVENSLFLTDAFAVEEVTVNKAATDGNEVLMELTYDVTWIEDFQGYPFTGMTASVPMLITAVVEDELITSFRAYYNPDDLWRPLEVGTVTSVGDAEPATSITLDTLLDDPEAYLGTRVSVEGEVERLLTDVVTDGFDMSDDDFIFDEHVFVIGETMTVMDGLAINDEDNVLVTGTVRLWDSDLLLTDYGWAYDPDLYTDLNPDDIVIVADSVEIVEDN
jgi:hypothetical protein